MLIYKSRTYHFNTFWKNQTWGNASKNGFESQKKTNALFVDTLSLESHSILHACHSYSKLTRSCAFADCICRIFDRKLIIHLFIRWLCAPEWTKLVWSLAFELFVSTALWLMFLPYRNEIEVTWTPKQQYLTDVLAGRRSRIFLQGSHLSTTVTCHEYCDDDKCPDKEVIRYNELKSDNTKHRDKHTIDDVQIQNPRQSNRLPNACFPSKTWRNCHEHRRRERRTSGRLWGICLKRQHKIPRKSPL